MEAPRVLFLVQSQAEVPPEELAVLNANDMMLLQRWHMNPRNFSVLADYLTNTMQEPLRDVQQFLSRLLTAWEPTRRPAQNEETRAQLLRTSAWRIEPSEFFPRMRQWRALLDLERPDRELDSLLALDPTALQPASSFEEVILAEGRLALARPPSTPATQVRPSLLPAGALSGALSESDFKARVGAQPALALASPQSLRDAVAAVGRDDTADARLSAAALFTSRYMDLYVKQPEAVAAAGLPPSSSAQLFQLPVQVYLGKAKPPLSESFPHGSYSRGAGERLRERKHFLQTQMQQLREASRAQPIPTPVTRGLPAVARDELVASEAEKRTPQPTWPETLLHWLRLQRERLLLATADEWTQAQAAAQFSRLQEQGWRSQVAREATVFFVDNALRPALRDASRPFLQELNLLSFPLSEREVSVMIYQLLELLSASSNESAALHADQLSEILHGYAPSRELLMAATLNWLAYRTAGRPLGSAARDEALGVAQAAWASLFPSYMDRENFARELSDALEAGEDAAGASLPRMGWEREARDLLRAFLDFELLAAESAEESENARLLAAGFAPGAPVVGPRPSLLAFLTSTLISEAARGNPAGAPGPALTPQQELLVSVEEQAARRALYAMLVWPDEASIRRQIRVLTPTRLHQEALRGPTPGAGIGITQAQAAEVLRWFTDSGMVWTLSTRFPRPEQGQETYRRERESLVERRGLSVSWLLAHGKKTYGLQDPVELAGERLPATVLASTWTNNRQRQLANLEFEWRRAGFLLATLGELGESRLPAEVAAQAATPRSWEFLRVQVARNGEPKLEGAMRAGANIVTAHLPLVPPGTRRVVVTWYASRYDGDTLLSRDVYEPPANFASTYATLDAFAEGVLRDRRTSRPASSGFWCEVEAQAGADLRAPLVLARGISGRVNVIYASLCARCGQDYDVTSPASPDCQWSVPRRLLRNYSMVETTPPAHATPSERTLRWAMSIWWRSLSGVRRREQALDQLGGSTRSAAFEDPEAALETLTSSVPYLRLLDGMEADLLAQADATAGGGGGPTLSRATWEHAVHVLNRLREQTLEFISRSAAIEAGCSPVGPSVAWTGAGGVVGKRRTTNNSADGAQALAARIEDLKQNGSLFLLSRMPTGRGISSASSALDEFTVARLPEDAGPSSSHGHQLHQIKADDMLMDPSDRAGRQHNAQLELEAVEFRGPSHHAISTLPELRKLILPQWAYWEVRAWGLGPALMSSLSGSDAAGLPSMREASTRPMLSGELQPLENQANALLARLRSAWASVTSDPALRQELLSTRRSMLMRLAQLIAAYNRVLFS